MTVKSQIICNVVYQNQYDYWIYFGFRREQTFYPTLCFRYSLLVINCSLLFNRYSLRFYALLYLIVSKYVVSFKIHFPFKKICQVLTVGELGFPADIHLYKFNNGNTRKMCEIYSKLTIRHQNDVDI